MSPRLSGFLTLMMASLLCGATPHASEGPEDPHAFGPGDCRGCHVTNPARLRFTPGEKMRMVAPVDQLCARCHGDITENYAHPMDVVPASATLPQDMPLARNGHITCNTCHDIHGPASTPLGQRSFYLRRAARGKEFCLVCHPDNPIQTLAARKFRGKTLPSVRSAKYTIQDPGISIDSTSVKCLGCHDASGAAGMQGPLVGAGTWEHSGDGHPPHPIGVHYGLAQARSSTLVPESMRDKSLKLFDGRVGCGTCHDSSSWQALKLTVERKRICASCHLD